MGASDDDWEPDSVWSGRTGKTVLSRETGVLRSILGIELPDALAVAWRAAISAGWCMGFNSGYRKAESSGPRSAEVTTSENYLAMCTP